MEPRTLMTIATRRSDEFLSSLEEVVNIDSGSFTAGGVNRVADLCEKRFRAGGWEVDRIEHRPDGDEQQLGDLLIGRFPGDGPNVLLIGHMDTVFDEGTAAARPFRIEDGRARGPGVSDMKSGLLNGFFATEVLAESGSALGNLTYICNPDEEIGSPFSGPIIADLAGSADIAFVLEGARESGAVVSSRKGVADIAVEIIGRAAHAGVEPERGRSATLEAAHKTVALHGLNGRWPGVSVNVGVIEGGTRPNVVADRCRLWIDVRAAHRETQELVQAEIERICATHLVPDVDAITEAHTWHRPMEKGPATERILSVAGTISTDLGFELTDEPTGGASDANTTSAAGVPTLDGLGMVGGGDHGPAEWMAVESVPERMALLASLIGHVAEHGVP